MNTLKFLPLVIATLLVTCTAFAQQPQPQPPQQSADSSRTRFFDKIGHWVTAYTMSAPEYLEEERRAFKARAFAEVYVNAIIDKDVWLFKMLNRVTEARYPERQTPYVLFTVKLKPNEPMTAYTVTMVLSSNRNLGTSLTTIVNNAAAAHLTGKTYKDPMEAAPDIEKALLRALGEVATAVGKDLAPKLLLRYNDEVFWNGHQIDILDAEGNFVELEAIDPDLKPIPPAQLTWTNADAFENKGVVDMTNTAEKQVQLQRRVGSETHSLSVTLRRVNVSQDINQILKALIIEALSAKKQQARDSIARFKADSVTNANDIARYLASIEAENFPMEGEGVFAPMSEAPTMRPDSTLVFANPQVGPGLKALKARKKLRSKIRRKLNVVALADLIVDHPEKVSILLDELLRNSGRLIGRLILSTDSNGERAKLRDIVLDFLNKNLERIAGGQYPASLSQEPPLAAAPKPAQRATFDPQKHLYVNPRMTFPGKDEVIQRLTANIDADTYVFINYSQDVSMGSFQARVKGTRPAGLPAGAKYKVFTVLHVPGSLAQWETSGEDAPVFGPFQYLLGYKVVPGSFNQYATPSTKGFTFLTITGGIITVPADASDVTFNDEGLISAFTISENGARQRYVSTNYTGTNTFAGMRKSLDVTDPPYSESNSNALGANPKVYLGLINRASNGQCSMDVYSSTFIGSAPTANTGGDHNAKAEVSTIASKLTESGGSSTTPNYGTKIKLVKSVASPDACDLCAAGQKFVARFTSQLRSQADHDAVFNTAKRICEFGNNFPGTDLIAAFTAENESSTKDKLSRWMFPADAARLSEIKSTFWARSDAWQIYQRRLEAFLDFYFTLKSNSALTTWPNDKIKSIVNARTPEFLNLYSIEERIGIISNLLPSSKPQAGFANIDDQFVGDGEESAIIKILKSVVTQADALKMLTALSKDSFIEKLNFHIDDVGLGDDNYTALAKEFQRLSLLRAGITDVVDKNKWATLVPENNHFIYNDNRTFSFGSVQPVDGAIYYKTVSYDATGAMTISFEVCEEVSSISREVNAGRSETMTRLTVSCTKKTPYTKTPHYFDLVSIDVIELDFLSPDINANAGRAVITYAGFLEYIEEKKGTDQASTITEYSINAASLAFGIGEIALIIKTGANAGRIALATVDLGSQVADLVISSDVFAKHICNGQKDCPQLQTIRNYNTLAQITALALSGFDIVRNWNSLNPAKFTRFANFENLRKLPRTILAKLDAENWSDDVLRLLDADLANSALRSKFFENPGLVESWKKLFHADISDVIRKNPTYLSAVSKQISNYGDKVLFKFERILPHIEPSAYDKFFDALNNPRSIDHVRSLVGDFENIPGISLSKYVNNSLPKLEIPAPSTWADPLLALPGETATTFTRSVTAKTLSPGQKIYRVLSIDQRPSGGFWTYELPKTKADLFGGTAVRPEWNGATHYVEYTIPEGGLKVWDGPTASQPVLKEIDEVSLPGGDIQIYVPDPYRELGNKFDNLQLKPIDLK